MTEKQLAAFERSAARRRAAGLVPAKPTPRAIAPGRQKSAGCSSCKKAKEERSLANKLATAILSEPEVTPEVLAQRQAICAACPHAKRFLKKITTLSQCSLCKCVIKWKTRLATEECPDGRWAAVDNIDTTIQASHNTNPPAE